jgi:UDP-N-acetylglucosamine acyltransferase
MTIYAQDNMQALVSNGLLKADASVVIESNVVIAHPTDSGEQKPVIIGKNSRIASGTIIYSGARVGENCQIGHHSVIGANVEIGDSTSIGHGCVIDGESKLGNDNQILHGTLIAGESIIGDRNKIGPLASLGQPPQHARFPESCGPLYIGNDNILREYVIVHGPAEHTTRIGNSNYLMAYSNVPHDAILEDHITLSPKCQLGGYCHIMHHANLGMTATVHQFSVIGPGTMIGMGSVVTKDVPPYVTFYRGKAQKLNRIGMQRMERSSEEIEAIVKWYRETNGRPLQERLESVRETWWYEDLQRFLELSQRTISDLSLL